MQLCLPESRERIEEKEESNNQESELLPFTSIGADTEASQDNLNVIAHPSTYCKKDKILKRTTTENYTKARYHPRLKHREHQIYRREY